MIIIHRLNTKLESRFSSDMDQFVAAPLVAAEEAEDAGDPGIDMATREVFVGTIR